MIVIMMYCSLNERPVAPRTLEITSLPPPLAHGEQPPPGGQPIGLLTPAVPEPLLHPGASRVLQSDISCQLSFAQRKKLTFISDHSLFHLWNFF